MMNELLKVERINKRWFSFFRAYLLEEEDTMIYDLENIDNLMEELTTTILEDLDEERIEETQNFMEGIKQELKTVDLVQLQKEIDKLNEEE